MTTTTEFKQSVFYGTIVEALRRGGLLNRENSANDKLTESTQIEQTIYNVEFGEKPTVNQTSKPNNLNQTELETEFFQAAQELYAQDERPSEQEEAVPSSFNKKDDNNNTKGGQVLYIKGPYFMFLF